MTLEFRGEAAAKEHAPAKHVYDAWMRFACENGDETAKVLDAINDSRTTGGWTPVDPPAGKSGVELARWAEEELQPLIARVVDEMEDVIERLG